ncbi:MAG: hypothetical protein ACLFS9_03170, partial [Nitriliruptoraceae bacterium]
MQASDRVHVPSSDHRVGTGAPTPPTPPATAQQPPPPPRSAPTEATAPAAGGLRLRSYVAVGALTAVVSAGV